MCIFCNSETENEDLEKYYTQKCNNCNGKISIFKKNGKIFVTKFSKYDKLWQILFFSPFLLLSLFIFLIIFGRINQDISTENIIKILFIGLTLLITFYVFSCIINLINFKKKGFMYSGLINLVKFDGNKKEIIFLKIVNIIFIQAGIVTIVVFCKLILNI